MSLPDSFYPLGSLVLEWDSAHGSEVIRDILWDKVQTSLLP